MTDGVVIMRFLCGFVGAMALFVLVAVTYSMAYDDGYRAGGEAFECIDPYDPDQMVRR